MGVAITMIEKNTTQLLPTTQQYRRAYKFNSDVIFYFDAAGNKYVASGGSLAWRINNPGLVKTRGHFACSNGTIGSCGPYAIFFDAQQGMKALSAWLHSKKYYEAKLRAIAEYYQPDSPESFLDQLISLTKISANIKIKSLSEMELQRLLLAIQKLSRYSPQGNESFLLLPKIVAKIENEKGLEDTYLISDNTVLTKKGAVEQILSHQLDGVIVHERKGSIHLRSRPNHCMWNIRMPEATLPALQGSIDVLIRTVGERKQGQCIWGFINGINNTKEEAVEAATRISLAADGEAVFSMPNDTAFYCIKDGLVCITLKFICDTPIVQWAAKFFRYLLCLQEKDKTNPLVVIFAHSQGAIIAEHALELLNDKERKRLLIFTFGGGSFIVPGKSHPESHNYASAADFVCRMGSPNLQYYALERYYSFKKGQTEKDVMKRLAMLDAMFDLDTTDPRTMELYSQTRLKYYEKEFEKIRNVTVLDPDPQWKHKFESSCYQSIVKAIIKKYQRNQS